MPDRTVYRGTAFSCDADDRVQALVDHLFVVEDGFITAVLPADDPAAPEAVGDAEVVSTQPGQYWLPGFVDLHVVVPPVGALHGAYDLHAGCEPLAHQRRCDRLCRLADDLGGR